MQEYAKYDPNSQTYPWIPIDGFHGSSMLKPIPEVVKCTTNVDGSITISVEAVLMEDGTDCAFCHEVTIKENQDGTWVWTGNQIDEKSVNMFSYKARVDQ